MQSIRSRSFTASVALAVLAGCHDGATEPVKPASIAIVDGSGQVGTVGQRLGASPTFVVKDEGGRAISGVSVTIAVTAGNGTVANAPRKSSAGSTSVGVWTLGQKAGANQLTVTVAGLPPIVFEAIGARRRGSGNRSGFARDVQRTRGRSCVARAGGARIGRVRQSGRAGERSKANSPAEEPRHRRSLPTQVVTSHSPAGRSVPKWARMF